MKREDGKIIRIARQCTNSHGIPKKTFNSFEDAMRLAKIINKKPKTIRKLVAYKCSCCLKFHIGKSLHGTILIHDGNIYKNQKL